MRLSTRKRDTWACSTRPDLIIIQVTWVGGRSVDVKKRFFRHIADEIHDRAEVRKEDVWISLVEKIRSAKTDLGRRRNAIRAEVSYSLSKATLRRVPGNVRYWHKADLGWLHCRCPLSAVKRT